MFQTSDNTDNTITAYAIIRTVYHAYYIYLLVFIIFILYRSVFRSSAIRSYSFPVNISAQYSLVGLLFFLHYTIIQYIFSKLFYIIIPSVLSLHNISILSVYSYIAYIFRSYIHYFYIYYIIISCYLIILLVVSMITYSAYGNTPRPHYILWCFMRYTLYIAVY